MATEPSGRGRAIRRGWLALDAADPSVGRSPSPSPSPPPPSDALLRDAGRVGRALDREPRGRAEPVAALDLPAGRVETALDELVDRGTVERRNGVYHATGSGLDPTLGPPVRRALDLLR